MIVLERFLKSGNSSLIICPQQAEELLRGGASEVHYTIIRLAQLNHPVSYPPNLHNLHQVKYDFAALEQVNRLANNLYVPSTQQSRQFGAGSTKSDND